MADLDPGNAATYRARVQDFSKRLAAATERWQQQAAPLRGAPVATQHKTWTYLIDWLGLKEVATLEPKPGIPPSSGYLSQVVETVRQQPVKLVIRGNYEDPRPSDFLKERAGVPVAVLPSTVGGTPAAKDLFGLYDDTVNRLLAAAGAR